jgi:hypothetical protein
VAPHHHEHGLLTSSVEAEQADFLALEEGEVEDCEVFVEVDGRGGHAGPVEFYLQEGAGCWRLGDDGGGDFYVFVEGKCLYEMVIEAGAEVFDVLEDVVLGEGRRTCTMLAPAR